MESCKSNGVGLMAVVAAVSGSVVLVALQLHKRLASDFFKKFESELGVGRDQPKKKVRFAGDMMEPSSNYKDWMSRRNKVQLIHSTGQIDGTRNHNFKREKISDMPLNRIALYRGIMEYRILKGRAVYY